MNHVSRVDPKTTQAVDPSSGLAKLLGNTLSTIAMPPGRIYESHDLAVSPTDELKGLAKAAAETANSMKPSMTR